MEHTARRIAPPREGEADPRHGDLRELKMVVAATITPRFSWSSAQPPSPLSLIGMAKAGCGDCQSAVSSSIDSLRHRSTDPYLSSSSLYKSHPLTLSFSPQPLSPYLVTPTSFISLSHLLLQAVFSRHSNSHTHQSANEHHVDAAGRREEASV